MKKTIRGITHEEPGRRRMLRLSKEAIRTLSSGELMRAAGGSVCDTTSWTTEKTQSVALPTNSCK
jgi:hypothetical protein